MQYYIFPYYLLLFCLNKEELKILRKNKFISPNTAINFTSGFPHQSRTGHVHTSLANGRAFSWPWRHKRACTHRVASTWFSSLPCLCGRLSLAPLLFFLISESYYFLKNVSELLFCLRPWRIFAREKPAQNQSHGTKHGIITHKARCQ